MARKILIFGMILVFTVFSYPLKEAHLDKGKSKSREIEQRILEKITG